MKLTAENRDKLRADGYSLQQLRRQTLREDLLECADQAANFEDLRAVVRELIEIVLPEQVPDHVRKRLGL